MVEAVGHRKPLVEPALHVLVLRGDRHAVSRRALDQVRRRPARGRAAGPRPWTCRIARNRRPPTRMTTTASMRLRFMLSSRILRRALEYSHSARNSIARRDPQLAGRGPKRRPRIRASPGGPKWHSSLTLPPAWRAALAGLVPRCTGGTRRGACGVRIRRLHPAASENGARFEHPPVKDGAPDYYGRDYSPAGAANSPPGARDSRRSAPGDWPVEQRSRPVHSSAQR